MKGLRLSIKARLMLYISLLVLLLIGGTSLFSYFSLRQVVGDGVAREAQAVTEKNAEVVSQWLSPLRMNSICFPQFQQCGVWLDEARALMAADGQQARVRRVLLADLTSENNDHGSLTINIAAGLLQRSLRDRENLLFRTYDHSGTNVATVMVARPVLGDDSRPVGVLAFSVTLEHLQQVAESLNLAGYGHGWLINDTGVVVGHPNLGMWEHSAVSDISGLKPIVEQMLAGRSRWIAIQPKGPAAGGLRPSPKRVGYSSGSR